VCALGPSAIAPIVELEFGDVDRMLSRGRVRYPPSVVRIELLRSFAAATAAGDEAMLGGVDPTALVKDPAVPDSTGDLRARAAADLSRVPNVVAALYERPFDRLGTLPELHGWSSSDAQTSASRFRQAVAGWRRGLLGDGPLVPERSTDAPRRVVAGAVAAWRELATIEDAACREERCGALADRLLGILPDCREEDTRAAQPVTMTASTELGRELAAELLALPEDAL
jgi:hypothetical protein